MKKEIRFSLMKPLLALSLGLNLAFAAMWVFPLLSGRPPGSDMSGTGSIGNARPPALHKDIGVTEEQWRQLAPLVEEFREKAGKQRKKINTLRGEMMELLAMSGVAIGSIRFKQEDILWNQQQMQNLVIEHLLKEKKILSPEQMKKLIETLCLKCSNGNRATGDKGMGCVLGKKLGTALNAARGPVQAEDQVSGKGN